MQKRVSTKKWFFEENLKMLKKKKEAGGKRVN